MFSGFNDVMKGEMAMMPIGPLMIEHRLIEKGIKCLEKESKRIASGGKVDPVLIDTMVDFIRTYADRTHHGKEEGILFRELRKKPLSESDWQIMRELIEEHVFARKMTMELMAAKERYLMGEPEIITTLSEKLNTLAAMYPEHIAKEDKVFFPASMKYFSSEEQEAMLQEMWEFDRGMIHIRYQDVVAEMERSG